MKLTLLLMLLAGPAFAGGGSFFGPGGGDGASSSTGTHTDGASASFKNATAETLASTGTAPSLTATGAEFGSSITVRATAGQSAALFATAADEGQIRLCNRTRGAACSFGSNGLYQLGIGNSGTFAIYGEGETFLSYAYPNVVFNNTAVKLGIGTASPLAKLSVNGDSSFASPATFISSVTAPITQVGGTQATANGRAYQATDYLRVAAAAGNAGTDRTTVRWSGGGYDSAPSASNADSNGDKLVFYNDGTGKATIGLGASYDMWFQANGGTSAGFKFWTSPNTTPVNVVRITPSGGLRSYSRTIAQLLAITPLEVGEQFFCNNCSPAKLVVSTGTSAGNFSDMVGGPFQ